MPLRKSLPDTLGTLSASHRIHARCPTCDRYFDVDIEVLIERLGPNRETIEAMKRVTTVAGGRRHGAGTAECRSPSI
jgi:hypothetical protein